MATTGSPFVDRYALVARVVPTTLVLLPALAGAASWLEDASFLPKVIGLVGIPGGLLVVLAHLGRDRGKALEPALWQSWGGAPVVNRLRHRSGLLDPHARRRLSSKFALLRPPLVLPLRAQEEATPEAADRVYAAVQHWLKARTRDGMVFPLLLNENINYGFRRNCLGLRPFGVGAAVLGLVAVLAAVISAHAPGKPIPQTSWAYAGATILGLYWWAIVVRADWVRVPADEYASRLLEAVDQIPDEEFSA